MVGVNPHKKLWTDTWSHFNRRKFCLAIVNVPICWAAYGTLSRGDHGWYRYGGKRYLT